MNLRILILCCGIWLIGCKPEIISTQEKETFFDMEKYVNRVISDSLSTTVIKTIQVNGKSEQKKLVDYPLWLDIKNFAQYNINKPALLDKYQVDSLQEGNELKVSYISLDEKHHVSELQIWYQEQHIDSIRVLTSLKSFIEESTLEIRWTPGKGYVIDKNVQGRFSKEKNQHISVQVI